MSELIKFDPQPLEKEQVEKLVTWLQKASALAVSDLQDIKTIENDEQYAEAQQTLALAKEYYDKMSAKRKAFTDPIKAMIEQIMQYENAINYTTKTSNEYNRARGVLEEYNQKKVEAAAKVKFEAERRAAQLKYKAEFKSKVELALSQKLSGVHKNLIDSFTKWEAGLTLENIEAKEEALKKSNPVLKREYYDECFRVWLVNKVIMSEEEEKAYLNELKNEITYEASNEKFQIFAGQLKNDYLAKIPAIKERLQQIKQSADAAKLEQERKDQLEKERIAGLSKINAEQKNAEQEIQDRKDSGVMEAEFTKQAMTQTVDAGPTKKVVSFADKMWLKPFLQVVGKVAIHEKFKGIVNSKGDYIPEVQKWLDFYASNIGEPMDGLSVSEVAKTIVRKA